MTLEIPNLSLVVLIGVSGSGKSTFARAHFKSTEVLSSDTCRGLVSDDENNQAATKAAFEVLHFIAAKRLEAGLLTVVDATNVQPESRAPLIRLAREYHVLPVAVVLDVPEDLAIRRNEGRPDRAFGPRVVLQQASQLRRSLRGLNREGFRRVHILRSAAEVAASEIRREKLWNDRREEHGPFDFIGDVHGCHDELVTLLGRLGYSQAGDGAWKHDAGRKLVFVGELVDRGPKSPEVLRLVMASVAAGSALAVPGNHDVKFMRRVFGKNVALTHGLAETLEQFVAHEIDHPGFTRAAAEFVDSLVSHYVLDGGRVVVAHAGLKEAMHGRGSGAVREFCLYGETTGESDEFGLPVRYPWASDYRGDTIVVYGHTPVARPEWINRTIDIDTGCAFGGHLTALRYPEKELVSVPALAEYAVPVRPISSPGGTRTSQQELDDLLDLADVTGKRLIGTRLHHAITIREENATAALEVMSRFAADPKWLIHLPPTMSPSATSSREGLLEHPAEAFEYYRKEGVARVVCEEKHMGSRAIVIVCRDEAAARARFGVREGAGIVYTRTGRRFFDDAAMEAAILDRVRTAVGAAGLWSALETSWLCLDCELMPWSAKAQSLIIDQYAAVGAAAAAALDDETAALAAAAARGHDVGAWQAETEERRELAAAFTEAYRRYCWPVAGIEDLRLAAFHLLASEGGAHTDRPHDWHLEHLARLADGGVILATAHRWVDLGNDASEAAAIEWWEALTADGGEGMVVKPLEFATRGRRGLLQPAVKCRGREYLRIIYGPDYTRPANLDRLRHRGLGAKRSLALREFALGVEALERFVAKEPLRRVHECVFGVLALESEPVDPRL